jgi:hypothetical protein
MLIYGIFSAYSDKNCQIHLFEGRFRRMCPSACQKATPQNKKKACGCGWAGSANLAVWAKSRLPEAAKGDRQIEKKVHKEREHK